MARPVKDLTNPVGRLAMRHEGAMWNAYYALTHTMDGAIFLGSIAMRFVADPVRKNAFLDFMRAAVSDLIEEQCGERPVWPEGPEAGAGKRKGRSWLTSSAAKPCAPR